MILIGGEKEEDGEVENEILDDDASGIVLHIHKPSYDCDTFDFAYMHCVCMFKFFLFLDPNMDDEDELEDLSEEEHTPQGIICIMWERMS